jgi:hypothetical protein
MHKDVEDRSLAELAPSYEVAAAYLVHMLEASFVNLNPFMQQMFLKLHDIEDSEKKDFILETLRRELRDVAIEARKVFERFNNWLLLGDFNFMRSAENRNKPRVDMNDIFLFNEIISHLGLIELPLKGRYFTWSNMQDSPLLQ